MKPVTHKSVARAVGDVCKAIAGGNQGRASLAPIRGGDVIAALTDDQRSQVETVINRLFRELRAARPAWRQAWGTTKAMESAKNQWTTALIEGRCTDWDNQIEYGLIRLRAEPSDFVPSPGKFISWCEPSAELLGLPEVERAFAEACKKSHTATRATAKWSHPAVYHAAIDVGLDVLMFEPAVVSRKLFERSYAVMIRRVATQQQLGAAVPLGLGHDSGKTLAELAEEKSLQFAQRVREAQGITQTGEQARLALVGRFGSRGRLQHG